MFAIGGEDAAALAVEGGVGGRLAVRLSGEFPDVAACGAIHTAALVTTEPDSPHLSLAHAHAAYLFANADNDRSMTPDDVAALDIALDAAGLSATNEIVPNAAHGFTMSDTAPWNPEATERVFGQLRDLFASTLV